MNRILAFICCIVALGAAGPSTGNDGKTTVSMLLGTWNADLAQSRFKGRPPYKSGRMIVTAHGRTITVVRDVVTASGARFHIEYSDALDGRAVPVTGDPYFDSESTALSSPRMAIRTEFRGGRVTGHEQIRVAMDGLSLVARSSRTTPEDGHLYESVILWRRQPR
jgi:hypothetical protein